MNLTFGCSTLTLGILKKRYLVHVGRESLSPEARNYMKQVVEEELMKMQDSDRSGSDLENMKPQKKRKRETENDEISNDSEDESKAKKSRCQSSSSSESEDKEDCKTGSEESEEEDQNKSGPKDAEVIKPQSKANGNIKRQVASDSSTSQESSESEKESDESDGGYDKPKKKVKEEVNTVNNEETKTSKTSKEKIALHSEKDNETDTDDSEPSNKIKDNDSSDDAEKEKVSTEKKDNELDSDSSSLPSLEDEQNSGKENKQDNKKKKSTKKDDSSKDQKDENKAIVRLKRYIALCGARRNYKKLLDGCRSVRSKVAVLKKELEDLGVHGNPSIEKCKKVRMKREEAQELAELDVSNIIATQGRPKRRGTSAWQEKPEPPTSTYKRTLNSGSDSDEENNRGRRRATDWTNLQGIISDDADSD